MRSKQILRALLAQYLPESMIQKKKVGFSFVGENGANTKALQGLYTRLLDELKEPNCFINDYLGQQKMQLFIADLELLTKTRRLQVIWGLILLNSFMKNCRYKIIN